MPGKHKNKDTASSQPAPADATLPPAKRVRDGQLLDTEDAQAGESSFLFFASSKFDMLCRARQ